MSARLAGSAKRCVASIRQQSSSSQHQLASVQPGFFHVSSRATRSAYVEHASATAESRSTYSWNLAGSNSFGGWSPASLRSCVAERIASRLSE